MNPNKSPAPSGTTARDASRPDVLNAVTGLTPSDPLFAIRRGRQKISDATQASYDLFFGPAGNSLPIGERFLIALYACVLCKAGALEQHYRSELAGHDIDPAATAAVQADKLDQLQPSRLKAMLVFTRKLIVKPVEGDEAEIKRLQDAGMDSAGIVALAQLIAFLSYQIRVAAGLRAMKVLETQ